MRPGSTGKTNPAQKVVTPGTVNRPPATANKTTASKHNSKEFKDNFLKKIQFCSQSFDFNDDTKDTKEKSERLSYLSELSELLNDQTMVANLVIPHLDHVMEMIEKNIFRPLPVIKKSGAPSEPGMEDEEVIVDPSWPHLQPVYEFFLQLIVNDAIDVKSLKVFVTHTFIQEFLELFDSEEPREREYLKNILHRLYAKLVPRRKMIRKAITDCFYTLIHENYKFNGAAELLDILASIISGFAVPLREEHVYFFKTVIISLHKVQTCQLYHEQLLRCSMLFLSKDPSLAIPLVEGLLKYWPFGNSAKETAFLTELLEVLEVCDLIKLEPLIPRLFKRLIKCIAGPHLQVADRAMCFFENDYFLSILKTYKNQTFPMLVPVICAIADTHWHKVLQESLNALKTILKEIDYNSFEKALANKDAKTLYLVQDPKTLKKERAKVDEKWKMITKQAQLKNPNFKEPTVPYLDTHIVGEHNGLNNGNVWLM
jgi:serine/threonine-protein phosphatase 2A regulatory subunit B'